MKYLLSLFVSVMMLSACSNEKDPGTGNSGKIGPTKPTITGKPADFSGTWLGVGTLSEDETKKDIFEYKIVLKQTLDATGLPKDLEITIEVTDDQKDTVFISKAIGFVISAKTIDKTTEIYEIISTNTRKTVGQIGENGFYLNYADTLRSYNFRVTDKINLSFYGEKKYTNKKLILQSSLKKI